jgi:hypothetical protein
VNKEDTLDHLNGDYGYISLQDVLDRKWRIFDYATEVLLGTYDSIEEAIKGR